MSINRVWESVDRIEGNFLGFMYQIVRLGSGMWRATAHLPQTGGKIEHSKTLVCDSPGEALTKLAEEILKVSPIKD